MTASSSRRKRDLFLQSFFLFQISESLAFGLVYFFKDFAFFEFELQLVVPAHFFNIGKRPVGRSFAAQVRQIFGAGKAFKRIENEIAVVEERNGVATVENRGERVQKES